MASPAQILARIQRVNLLIPARQMVVEHGPDLAEINRDQLEQGLDSTGKKMAKYKNSRYALKKAQMNPRAGGVRDQKLTGSLYSAIRYKAGSSGYEATSESATGAYAAKRDGEQIYGLTPASIEIVQIKFLRPITLAYVQNTLSGK